MDNLVESLLDSLVFYHCFQPLLSPIFKISQSMQLVNQQNQIKINGLNINYKQIGSGDVLIVLLHGWGVSSDKYSELASEIFQIPNSKFQILIPDLPGFGKSDEPPACPAGRKENWGLDDYVEFVDKFIEKASRKSGFEMVKNLLKKFDPKKIIFAESQKASNREIKINDKQSEYYDNMNYHGIDVDQKKILKQVQDDNAKFKDGKAVILIGHSFGGRIAIKYAAKYPEKVDKLILTGAAGIKHRLNTKQKIFFILAKAGKKILRFGRLASYSQKILYKLAREKDYYQASPRMKEVMKNVLAEDLTLYLDKIKTLTLLVWGANDYSTPLSDGKIMNEKIENSELVIFDGANHSLPYQKPEEFAKIVLEFIK